MLARAPAWLRTALIALALLLSAGLGAQALQPVPPLTARVVDTIGLLDTASRARIESTLAALEREKGAQVVFLVVASTAPEDIASYANRVGNTWKVGRHGVGDGLLLVVARDDRHVRIEVAKTLEGAIPDLAAKAIIDEAVTPAFRRGDYAGGLDAAAERIAALVRGEPLPAPNPPRAGGSGDGFDLEDLAIFLFIAVPVLARVLRGMFGRKPGAFLAAGATGLIAWIVTASLLMAGVAAFVALVVLMANASPTRGWHGRHGHGGGPAWPPSDGGWGAPTHGAGGFGGGFGSGGGGDFGGGGASGDW